MPAIKPNPIECKKILNTQSHIDYLELKFVHWPIWSDTLDDLRSAVNDVILIDSYIQVYFVGQFFHSANLFRAVREPKKSLVDNKYQQIVTSETS